MKINFDLNMVLTIPFIVSLFIMLNCITGSKVSSSKNSCFFFGFYWAFSFFVCSKVGNFDYVKKICLQFYNFNVREMRATLRLIAKR
jgi:hypothetical protein